MLPPEMADPAAGAPAVLAALSVTGGVGAGVGWGAGVCSGGVIVWILTTL